MFLTFDYRIRHQDIDCYRRLKPQVLESYLLDSAGQAADILGIGYQVLLERRLTWVLIRLTMQMQQMPTLDEHITIKTWVAGFAHGLSPRYFLIYRNSESGESVLIGEAASSWAIINLDTRQMENIFAEDIFQSIELHEPLALAFARIRKADYEQHQRHTITYSDLDYNNHCNSCRYLEMMLNAAPDILADNSPLKIDLFYQHEIYRGEEVDIAFQIDEKQTDYAVNLADGRTAVFGRIEKI